MKKRLSRALALLCALALALTMLMPAFAAEGDEDAGTTPPATGEEGGNEEVERPTTEEGQYVITLDCQGGTYSAAYRLTDTTGRLLENPNARLLPRREGYVFLGWFTEPEGGEGITENTFFTEDTTIYAHWRQDNSSSSSGSNGGSDDPGSSEPSDPSDPDTPGRPTVPTWPWSPGSNSRPSQVPPSTSAPSRAELNSQNWDIVSTANASFGFVYRAPGGGRATGAYYIPAMNARYLFDSTGLLVTGAQAGTQGNARVSTAGDVLMNGNLYYLNPNRDVNDPRTCYVMTNYLRVRDGYAGQTYYDQDGITFEGWIKTGNGGLRYQTRIPRPFQQSDLYLIVWRLQYLPACQHPDHPGDARYTMPAGFYFFDDNGVLVQREGWHDGKDGNEYYTNTGGQVVQQRVKQ